MEPNWTKQISSNTVCNFFYAFFVIYAFFAVVSLLGLVGLFVFSAKMPKGVLVVQSLYAIITVGLATTMALFHYLICDRALKPGSKVSAAPESNPNMVAY
jgi:hypothetical protein